MSSLIICHDLHIMMLELVVEKLTIPDGHIFDSVTLRKTTLMFRTLDNNWIDLQPQKKNNRQYNGSNKEEENFYGGKSVVFAISERCLRHKVKKASIKIRAFKEISKYFETERCYDAGVTYIDIHSLFNGIIKELLERKAMKDYFTHFHKREPISRSMKGTFSFISPKSNEKTAEMIAYLRLSHFGKSIITEFNPTLPKQFTFCEETYEGSAYECLELTKEALESDQWDYSVARLPQQINCDCKAAGKLDNFPGTRQWPVVASQAGSGNQQINENVGAAKMDNLGSDQHGRTIKKIGKKKNQKNSEVTSSDEFHENEGKVDKNGKKWQKMAKNGKLKDDKLNDQSSFSPDRLLSKDSHSEKGIKRKKDEFEESDEDNRKRRRKMTSKSEDSLEDDDGIEVKNKRKKRGRDGPLTDDEEAGTMQHDGRRSPEEIAKRREYLKSTARGAVTIGLMNQREERDDKNCRSKVTPHCILGDYWIAEGCYRLPLIICGFADF